MRRLSCNVGISLLSPLGIGETEETDKDESYPGVCVFSVQMCQSVIVHNIDVSPCRHQVSKHDTNLLHTSAYNLKSI